MNTDIDPQLIIAPLVILFSGVNTVLKELKKVREKQKRGQLTEKIFELAGTFFLLDFFLRF